ncbi:hypothetical protein NUSPORA_00242 [Nucleospora cyclopteri]
MHVLVENEEEMFKNIKNEKDCLVIIKKSTFVPLLIDLIKYKTQKIILTENLYKTLKKYEKCFRKFFIVNENLNPFEKSLIKKLKENY